MATTDLIGVESDADAQARIARVEQRMLDAEAVRTAAETPAREAKTVAYSNYEAALTAGREIGARRADDAALMALFCEGPLQTLVGAVSPELVWDGAQRKGLTTRELGKLANSDVMAVSDLQWDDESPTAPLPAPAAEALSRLESAFASPVERLRKQIARLEESLRIQREARDAAQAAMRDMSLPEAARIEAANSFQSAAWEVIALQGQIREYKAELSAATGYATASARATQLNKRIDDGVKLSALEWDDLAHAEDLMAGTKATLVRRNRLDLVGGGW